MPVSMTVCRKIIHAEQALAPGEPAKSAFFIGLYYLGHKGQRA